MSSTLPPPHVEYGADEISAIVLDPGYSVTRAGFAGEDTPKSVVPTYYGQREADGRLVFDDNAIHNPEPALEIHNPLNKDSVVEDWDSATKLWEYAITSRLIGHKPTSALRNGLNDPEDKDHDVAMEDAQEREKPLEETPLLMTEPGWNPTKNREKAMEIAMENWGCPAFFMARSGVMAAFGGGKPTALVVDVGAANTSVTTVYDGLMLKKGTLKSPLAGDWLSSQVRHFLSSSTPPITITPHYLVRSKTPVDANASASAIYRSFASIPTSFRRLQEDRVISEFKESIVQIWAPARNMGRSLGDSLESLRGGETRPFEFPDGFNTAFGADRFRCAEGLFDEKAALGGTEAAPLHAHTIPAMVQTALAGVDVDLRPQLLGNVVVAGGTSLTVGFNERLMHELQQIYQGQRVRINSPGNVVERKYASWVGGSILASLGSFHQMWISKKEYDEAGASILERRCK